MLNKRLLFFCSFVLLSQACSTKLKINSVEPSVILINKIEIPFGDSLINGIIAPYKQKFGDEMDEVLAVSDTVMVKGIPEGLLGNFVADLTLLKANE